MDRGLEVDRDLIVDVGPGLLIQEVEPPLYPRVIDKHVQPGICFRGPAMEIRPLIHVGDIARTEYEAGVFLLRLPERILAASADDDGIPVLDELAGEAEPYSRPAPGDEYRVACYLHVPSLLIRYFSLTPERRTVCVCPAPAAAAVIAPLPQG